MAISDLLLFSGLALFCGWSWPVLRLLSFFLLLAAGATLGLFGQALVAGVLKGIEHFDFRSLVPGGNADVDVEPK
jgi:hypothetical protein